MRFALIAFTTTLIACTSARADEPKLPVKVVYAGKPGTERSRDFSEFLGRRVEKVGTVEFAKFRDQDVEGYDVVILDGDPVDLDSVIQKDAEHPIGWPRFSTTYSRPTVLIGSMGGQVAKRQELKFSWLCNCLDNLVHVLSPAHELFKGPVAAALDVEDYPTPPRYRDWPGGATLGASIPSWKVQKTAWMGRDDLFNATTQRPPAGLVLDPYGFEDSPDCEAIAAGLNWKGWDAIAIARQANFLFWGFASSPSDMTPAGQACFLNSLAFIKKFDGQRPLFPRTHYDRTMWLKYASTHGFIDDEPTYATMMPGFLRQRLGSDYDGYVAYYRENLEYLHPTGVSYVVGADEDAKALGLSNRRVDTLDAWINRLEANDRAEVAGRLLKRYTLESFDDAKAWRTWFDRNRNRLYFSDTGGFKFRVAPEGLPATIPAERTPLDPDVRHPVAAKIALAPDQLKAGAEFTVTVNLRLAPNWHIYAVQGNQGAGKATSLSLELPEGVETAGPWELPAAGSLDGVATYSGSIEFKQRLRVRPDASQKHCRITCKLGFQACDPIRCLPPTTVNLSAGATVSP